MKTANVTLLVGGSIAAYKSAEIVRELVKEGCRVSVGMSKAAQEFITPLTMQTLSNRPVFCDLFDLHSEATIGHIQIADKADVVVVAPATADILAKAAAGMADDVVTTVLLAAKCPVLFVPAMNVNMWEHPAVRRNVDVLRAMGMHVAEPESGELACGWTGPGRLPEVRHIVQLIQGQMTPKDLTGSHVIVSAGPTREPLDPIRFLSNRSSGRMGYAIARNAVQRGAVVSLVTGPTSIDPPLGVIVYRVNTAQEMRTQMMELVSRGAQGVDATPLTQFVFMVAAVSDHRPKHPSPTKLKTNNQKPFSLELEPTTDILHEIGEKKSDLEKQCGRVIRLVGFAAETGDPEEVLDWAKSKLEAKNLDLVVGNLADEAFEKDTNRVWLLDRIGRQEEVSTAEKDLIASLIISAALKAS